MFFLVMKIRLQLLIKDDNQYIKHLFLKFCDYEDIQVLLFHRHFQYFELKLYLPSMKIICYFIANCTQIVPFLMQFFYLRFYIT